MQRDVFISYSRKDLDLVKQIKKEIEEAVGIECWMDLNGIESGSPQFTKDIVDGINKCKAFVFMLTEHSQESEFALRELNYAYKKKEKQGKHVVIININDCQLNDEFDLMYGLTDTILWPDKPQHDKFIRDLKKWVHPSKKLYNIFISYSRKDLDFVKQIEKEIEEAVGIECWRMPDNTDIVSHNYTKAIIDGIDNCKVFLFLLSENSQRSVNVLKELEYAIKRKIKVIIINIDNCALEDIFKWRYGLSDIISWTNKLEHDKLLQNLVEWGNR